MTVEENKLTLQVLTSIRDEIREMKGDIRELNGDVRELKVDVRALKGDVRDLKQETVDLREGLTAAHARIVESEIRTATALTDLSGSVRDLTSLLRAQHDLRPRVEKCELDIAELRKHVS